MVGLGIYRVDRDSHNDECSAMLCCSRAESGPVI